MTQEKLYGLSCRAADELLALLDRGGVEAAARRIAAIRRYAALAETVPAGSLQGAELHRREQLEFLAGLAELLERRLGRLEQEAAEVGASRNLRWNSLPAGVPLGFFNP